MFLICGSYGTQSCGILVMEKLGIEPKFRHGKCVCETNIFVGEKSGGSGLLLVLYMKLNSEWVVIPLHDTSRR